MFSTKGIILSKLDLLSRVTHWDIIRFYLKGNGTGKVSCPYHEDKTPSMQLYEYSESYHCFSCKKTGINGINLVKDLFNISYKEALDKISGEMCLDTKIPVKENKVLSHFSSSKEKPWYPIKVVSKEFSSEGLKFWDDFGIKYQTLKYFNVKELEGYYFKGYYFKCKTLTFSYYSGKKDEYKLYSPFAEKQYKWLDSSRDWLQGYNQLPEKDDLLVITKSLKDVMLFYEYNIPSVAPNSEKPTINNIDELKKRFKKIMILYDNDVHGISAANKASKRYNVPNIILPKKYGVKDLSDYRKKYGNLRTKQLLRELM